VFKTLNSGLNYYLRLFILLFVKKCLRPHVLRVPVWDGAPNTAGAGASWQPPKPIVGVLAVCLFGRVLVEMLYSIIYHRHVSTDSLANLLALIFRAPDESVTT
jgi:hypothetical protein